MYSVLMKKIVNAVHNEALARIAAAQLETESMVGTSYDHKLAHGWLGRAADHVRLAQKSIDDPTMLASNYTRMAGHAINQALTTGVVPSTHVPGLEDAADALNLHSTTLAGNSRPQEA